jgi:hypothetical protein
MKVTFICLFLLFSICLIANPNEPNIISELWYADNGHLMMEIFPHYFSIGLPDSTEVGFFDGTTYVPLPDSIVIQDYQILVLDVDEVLPALDLNPEEDSLFTYINYNGYHMLVEGLKWGNGTGVVLRPLQANQSFVQYWQHDPEGVWTRWYKDAPPTPGTSPNNPIARDTLRIVVRNQHGNPIPNLPVYQVPYSSWGLYGYTDTSGVFVDTLYAGYHYFVIRSPETNEIVFQHGFYLEPNVTTTIPVTITMTDNNDDYIPVEPDMLFRAYPTPFNRKENNAITFEYRGNPKLRTNSSIRLYDNKGRFITKIDMPRAGKTIWEPDSNLSTGMYFARLISGNHILDTTALILLK